MPASPLANWYHSNRYSAESACLYCEGVVRHEHWCATCNRAVLYAYQIVLKPENLTTSDKLILHALGIVWANDKSQGSCQKSVC